MNNFNNGQRLAPDPLAIRALAGSIVSHFSRSYDNPIQYPRVWESEGWSIDCHSSNNHSTLVYVYHPKRPMITINLPSFQVDFHNKKSAELVYGQRQHSELFKILADLRIICATS